jgi:hypothetical protein
MAAYACTGLALLLLIASAAAAQSQRDNGTQVKCDDPSCERERARLEREKPSKTSFLDRVHLDLVGAPPEIGNRPSLVGLVGGHLTIAEFGRIHLFGPPGVMVAIQSSGDASGWRPLTALTWGISLRLVEFPIRGSSRRTVLFLNLTKLWTWGDFSRGTDFAGVSFAWKGNGDQRPSTGWSRSTNRTSSATEPTASLDMTRPR